MHKKIRKTCREEGILSVMGRLCAPSRLSAFIQSNPIRILLGSTLALLVLCVAIKSAKLDAELSSWIQRTTRIESELKYVSSAIGDGQGASSQLVLQTPSQKKANVLTVEALMIHLEAMAIATHVSVDLHDVTWSLKDLCFTPTPPVFDLHVTLVMDKIIPCVIKTPLDCFWEGSKLLGPDQPVNLGATNLFNFKWTSLSPLLMIQTIQQYKPHASFPYNTLIDWMQRVGITTGYQNKPCLDPSDPLCPPSAPNKLSGRPPDVGLQLTGGCRGFASNQMHWREEEIVGDVVKNKSGHITKASGLQSTILLMGEQDMYDYWRKTDKVQDINNWSAEKAKSVLDLWQKRFKEELDQFTRASSTSNSYRIHAMTSKLMLEPIEVLSLLDLTNFELCFAIMIIFTCLSCPNFKIEDAIEGQSFKITEDLSVSAQSEDKDKSGSARTFKTCSFYKRIPLALVASLFIGLTFIASLGLTSFMNLPFNMATTQVLPPIALYYGFNQFLTVALIYSRKLPTVPAQYLTNECMSELLPVILIESTCYTVALLVATIIPVPATRVFAFQAIAYIQLATIVSMILMPALIIVFLNHYLQPNSPQALNDTTENSEETIISRIQDDLKNIRADNNSALNFSAHLESTSLHTSLQLSATHSSRNQPKDPSLPTIDPNLDCSKSLRTDHPYDYAPEFTDTLPDLVTSSMPKKENAESIHKLVASGLDAESNSGSGLCDSKPLEENWCKSKLFETCAKNLAANKLVQVSTFLIAICIFVATSYQITNVKYGLQLKDIVARGTPEHESLVLQEENFPVYNVFAITKGNFDYANNQKLLYEFYKAIERIEGVVRNEDSENPKFWLAAFRDWLLEIQQKFDEYKEKRLFSAEVWSEEASDAAKLAYKLLVQTGRPDNPIDKRLVETNRLVDASGVINPKAFYHYLTAWVMNDVFTYANTEANFKPEPKIWSYDLQDLKIEKARPLTYAQIPFLMKLPANQDSLKTISEIRSLSQAFEQLGLPNFPTGIPFIFWDQFLNLDLLMVTAVSIITVTLFLATALITSDFKVAAIIIVPITLTNLELYCMMGFFTISFNSVLAVLLMLSIGISTFQTVQLTTVSICENQIDKNFKLKS